MLITDVCGQFELDFLLKLWFPLVIRDGCLAYVYKLWAVPCPVHRLQQQHTVSPLLSDNKETNVPCFGQNQHLHQTPSNTLASQY